MSEKLRPGPERYEVIEVGEHQEERHAHDDLGSDQRNEHQGIGRPGPRPRHLARPRASATPKGVATSIVSPANRRLWVKARRRESSWATEAASVRYHRVEKPCQTLRERPALNENWIGDEYREQRPGHIGDGHCPQHAGLPPGIRCERVERFIASLGRDPGDVRQVVEHEQPDRRHEDRR